MAVYPAYGVEDLAGMSGEEASEYTRTNFVAMALKQAKALFKLGTCLKGDTFPEDEDGAELAEFAILAMADAIYWAQPFQAVLRNPFSSETIGSYSYSKLTSAVTAGLPTGISWFDIAVGELSVCTSDVGVSGGINVFEENKQPHGNYGVYLGPGDQNPDTYSPDTYFSQGI
jgi:hypothetical protein